MFHVIPSQVSLADTVGVQQSGDKTAEELIKRHVPLLYLPLSQCRWLGLRIVNTVPATGGFQIDPVLWFIPSYQCVLKF